MVTMDLDLIEKQVLKNHKAPDFIIQYIEGLVSDAWSNGFECGQAD